MLVCKDTQASLNELRGHLAAGMVLETELPTCLEWHPITAAMLGQAVPIVTTDIFHICVFTNGRAANYGTIYSTWGMVVIGYNREMFKL